MALPHALPSPCDARPCGVLRPCLIVTAPDGEGTPGAPALPRGAWPCLPRAAPHRRVLTLCQCTGPVSGAGVGMGRLRLATARHWSRWRGVGRVGRVLLLPPTSGVTLGRVPDLKCAPCPRENRLQSLARWGTALVNKGSGLVPSTPSFYLPEVRVGCSGGEKFARKISRLRKVAKSSHSGDIFAACDQQSHCECGCR